MEVTHEKIICILRRTPGGLKPDCIYSTCSRNRGCRGGSTDAIMALYSICRTLTLHRGPSACKSRVVGGAPAPRGGVLVPAVSDPVRRDVRCAEGGGDDLGLYYKRLPDIHRPPFWTVLRVR